VAVAPDGGILVAGWRGGDLVLLGDGGEERLLRRIPAGALPAPAALAFGADGEVRVAYAFTGTAGGVRTTFRLWGPPGDRLVERTEALTGGPGLAFAGARALYAADTPDGIRVFEDGLLVETVGGPGAHTPRLVAHGGRVEVLHLAATARGTQLMRGGTPLTRPERSWRLEGPPDARAWPVYVTSAGNQPHPYPGFHGWDLAAYDAVAMADGIRVVCHESRIDRFFLNPVPGKPVQWLSTREAVPEPAPPPPPPTEATGTAYDPDAYYSRIPRHRVRMFHLD
jgi:hypothetical protein